MRKLIYLKNFINLIIRRIDFDWKTKIELTALKENLHKSDLDKFKKYTNNSDLARAELFSAKEKFIESKIERFPEPWRKDFQVSLNYFFNHNVPQIVISRFSYLYHKYEVNNHDCFYLVSDKILDTACGDINKTLELIDTAAKDFRDVII